VPETASASQPGNQLLRAIGRWSLTALVVNSIIGSGVFGLPSTVAGYLGQFSPIAVLLAGAGMGVIYGCFAEVASRFQQAGGPYLYARAAFGRGIGIQMAWMLFLGQVAAPAANANLFVIYLGFFWPHARDPLPRTAILTVLSSTCAAYAPERKSATSLPPPNLSHYSRSSDWDSSCCTPILQFRRPLSRLSPPVSG